MAKSLSGYFHDVKDWRSSRAVQRMSFAERGVYRDMLDEEWDSEEHSLPDDPAAVACLIAINDSQRADVLAAWDAVRRKFVTDRRHPGRMYNVRLERARRLQRKFRSIKVEAGRRGGEIKARNRRQTDELLASTPVAVLGTPLAKRSAVAESRVIAEAESRERETRAREPFEPDPDPPHRETDDQRAVEHFRVGWQRVYGHAWSLLISPLEHHRLREQLDRVGEAPLCAAMDAYFASREGFVVKAKHPLPLFLREPLKYLAPEQAEATEAVDWAAIGKAGPSKRPYEVAK